MKRTWVREIRDQKDTTEYILSEGLVRKVSATESVRLMLGRADGVQVWLNGDSLGIMGKPNEVVVTLLLTPKGIIEKRLKAPTVRNEPETSQPLLQSQPSTEFELRPNRSNTPAGGD